MQVVIHAGAHKTDEDRLINCLRQNQELLSANGTDVPDPRAYRKMLRDILQAAQQTGITDESREIVLDAINHDTGADRLVLSNPGFFGTPKMAVGNGLFYPVADRRLEAFRQIFPDDTLELFLALRNPATYLPALFEAVQEDTITDYLNGFEPDTFCWSETLHRVQRGMPEVQITVWCNEDSPLIWAQVVRELAGLQPTADFEGEFALLAEIMTETGMNRFQTYLDNHPGMTEIQKRRVIAAFLDKFVKEDQIEEELDIPGWTEQLIDQLSDAYDEDVYTIQRIPGVNLITP